MKENEQLAERFEENRLRLRGIAYRMLRSMSEAEDAVQETWLRLSRTEAGEINNLSGWLMTVTSRICLDMLRSRRMRREDSADGELLENTQSRRAENDPEQEMILADSIGLALIVVLETLSPSERLAFVLHDLFGTPFDEIAKITGQSVAATRQSASRARRRVRGKNPTHNSGQERRREIVEDFYAASRGGDFERLLTLLDPDVVLRTDTRTLPTESRVVIRGAATVANRALAGRNDFAEVAIVNGQAGIIVAPDGILRLALTFTIKQNIITKIDVIANPERLRGLRIAVLPD